MTAPPDQARLQAALQDCAADLAASRLDAAGARAKAILAEWPAAAAALHALGMIAFKHGEGDAAVALVRRAVAVRPDYAEAWANLGMMRISLDRAAARQDLRRAVALNPCHVRALANLATAETDPAAMTQALAWAVALEPGEQRLRRRLLGMWAGIARPAKAAAAVRALICLQPEDGGLWYKLAEWLRTLAEFDEAVAAHRRCGLLIRDAHIHSCSLGLMEHRPGWPLRRRAAERALYDALYGHPPSPPPAPAVTRERERPLTIGYVSPDFRTHAMALFLRPVLRAHDRGRFRIACYAEVAKPDDQTREFQGLADIWRNTVGVPDEGLAEMVRDDRVDILVDLAGHTVHNRLAAFRFRPAPIRMTWLGLPSPTGLSAIDYMIADHRLVPPGSEGEFTERVIRLPECFVCYDGSAATESDERRGDPAVVRFASFCKVAKLNPDVADVWARVMAAVPRSRLWLKGFEFDDEATRDGVRALFAQAGVDTGRIDFDGPARRRGEYARALADIDIALDTFPASGGTITIDTLLAGTPLVTLRGDRALGRYSASVLAAAGLPELIADSKDDYVGRAITLAGDAAARARLRTRIRRAMAASPLRDHQRFTGQLEQAYRLAWQRWCDGLTPAAIDVPL